MKTFQVSERTNFVVLKLEHFLFKIYLEFNCRWVKRAVEAKRCGSTSTSKPHTQTHTYTAYNTFLLDIKPNRLKTKTHSGKLKFNKFNYRATIFCQNTTCTNLTTAIHHQCSSVRAFSMRDIVQNLFVVILLILNMLKIQYKSLDTRRHLKNVIVLYLSIHACICACEYRYFVLCVCFFLRLLIFIFSCNVKCTRKQRIYITRSLPVCVCVYVRD